MKHLLIYFGLLVLSYQHSVGGTYGDFTYSASADSVTITKYNGNGSSVTVPSQIEGLPVTAIGNYAFQYATSITSLSLPSSLLSIGDTAFQYCAGITNLTIPSGTTSIGNYAFQYCYGLTSISIPNSVSYIGGNAFQSCTSLTQVTLPSSLTALSSWTFGECTSLSNVSFPSGLTSIGSYAFYGCTALVTVTLPNNLASIQAAAFHRCNNLVSINLPSTLSEMAESAFNGCTSLTSASIPDGITILKRDLFSGCSSLQSVTLPNSLISIMYNVFDGCSSLKNVVIPSQVAQIGQNAFRGCTSIENITIPASVLSLGYYNNSGGYGYNQGDADGPFQECSGLKTVTINAQITGIPKNAFLRCASLVTVNIPTSVQVIDEYAFYGCSSLASISIPPSVTDIKKAAFSGSGLTSFSLPLSVSTFAEELLMNCTKLVTLNIPISVTYLQQSSLENCSSLVSATIPLSVNSFSQRTFKDCKSLRSLTFFGNAPAVYSPNGNSDYNATFYGCDSLIIFYQNGRTGWGSTYGGRPTALIGNYLLTKTYDSTKGNISVSPQSDSYQYGTVLTVQASASPGYSFTGWSGDISGLSFSTTITMNSSKTISASFGQDLTDSDNDGLSNYAEIIVHGSNPSIPDSNADGIRDGVAVSLGYSPTFSFGALIDYLKIHPPADLYTASQMQNMAMGDLFLSKENGQFVLNYELQKSADLQTWSTHQSLTLPLSDLPPDKAFVRFQLKN